MKAKKNFQFRWVFILWLISIIYISNFILVKLPFVSFSIEPNTHSKSIFSVFFSFLPNFDFEFYIYNIQTLIVWATGIIAGRFFGSITVGIYLLLGLIGLPIFAGGGGLSYFGEPTFGYLISFPALAYLSGWFYEKNNKIACIFIPILATHLFGIFYLLIFKNNFIEIAWHLSFSMIGYDLIFAFVLSPVIYFLEFFLNELFIQEMPMLDFQPKQGKTSEV